MAHALNPGVIPKPWATKAELDKIDLSALGEQTFTLRAPISKVQGFLQKSLKPHRKQLSAVRFTNGRIEELTESTLRQIDTPPEPVVTDVAAAPEAPAKEEPKPQKPPKVEKAVTVSQPTLGCPAPDFDDVEIRATRVLKAFLTPEQIEDFNRRQQFIAIGADTGHRYLITSRHSKHALAQHQSYRSLYDMDERVPFCVHDWEVPAPEELLGLLVHVSIPGLERYVRNIPDREGILAR